MRFQGFSSQTDIFIETGTYLGESLAIAATQPYLSLHSCDIVEQYIIDARQKFQNDSRVLLHHGSSPEILAQIIRRDVATTFWLDAHFQGNGEHEQDASVGECPLLKELEVIFSDDWTIWPYVLIDDAKMFVDLPSGFSINAWPSLSQIVRLLPKHYQILIQSDVIYCTPFRGV